MNPRKLCLPITTRGNYAKLKPVLIGALDCPDLTPQVILAGGAILPKYGNIAQTMENKFEISRKIPFIIEGENLLSMAKSAGIALSEFATAFENIKPDIVMVVGDRYETLSIVIAASFMNIPVAHLEGGEVSGSIDESIRHAITKLSHLHFPCSQEAKERIIKLGEAEETVFTVGATSLDSMVAADLNDLSELAESQKTIGVGPILNLDNGYLVVLYHPVTTEYGNLRQNVDDLIEAINILSFPTIWLWPNMDAGSDVLSNVLRSFREIMNPSFIHFFKSLPIEIFGPLLNNCRCVIGNSSAGIRESAFLGVPSVNVGTRQQGRERGRNVMDVKGSKDEIVQAIKKQIAHGKYESDKIYGDGRAGQRIVNILKNFEFNIQKRINY